MIDVDRLAFHYGRSVLFEDFSIALSEPGVYGLFGRNGSGKSTLLKLLSGLLFPQHGSVRVLGYVPGARSPALLEQIYIVPEEFHLPDITLSRLQDVQAPFYPRFSTGHFRDYLDIFEVPANKTFGSMSLGQKKKAVIAFALATHTPLLLMDEPTNGLDIIGREQFRKIMAGSEHANRLVMISTHQAHDLESLMSHVLFVDGGTIALSASMRTLQASLRMGVTEMQEPGVIYQESIGKHWAYVSGNDSGVRGAVHLELLYKALSFNKPAVLAAVAQGEKQAGVQP